MHPINPFQERFAETEIYNEPLSSFQHLAMKKSDYVLAQKTLAAREIKIKSKQIKEELQVMKANVINTGMKNKKNNMSSTAELLLNSPTMKKSSTLPSLNTGSNNFSDSNNYLNNSSSASNFQFNDSIPKLQSSNLSKSVDDLYQFTNTNSNQMNSGRANSNPHSMTKEALAMVEELSKRTVTDKTNLRKLQHQVSMSLESSQLNSTNNHQADNIVASDAPSRQLSSRNSFSATGSNSHMINTTNNNTANNISSARRPSTTNSYQNMFSNNNNNRNSTSRLATIAEVNNNRSNTATNSAIDWNNTSAADFTNTSSNHQFNTIENPAASNSNSTSTNKFKVKDENYFMPKKKTLRNDGASLLDVYMSKKEDMWGKILHAQIKEDDINQRQLKKKKDEDNKQYGSLLKKQVNDNLQRKQEQSKEHEYFAQLEQQTAKKYDDLEKKRNEDAIARHKQFIANALEDMHTKHHQKQNELREELTASSIMVNRAKELLAMEEEKKKEDREYHRKYQERIFQENLENIARKQNNKLASFAEDKKIFEENERQFQRETQRREMELSKRLELTSEGPAHHIVEAIAKKKKAEDDKFYHDLMYSENNLNKQLKASEDAAKAREKKNGQSVTDEWIKHATIQAQLRKEEEDRNNKILATMRKMIHDQEEEDRQKRLKKHQDAMIYQQELDAQVTALRQRSIDQLQKTMSEQEAKYNSDLIRKTAKFL